MIQNVCCSNPGAHTVFALRTTTQSSGLGATGHSGRRRRGGAVRYRTPHRRVRRLQAGRFAPAIPPSNAQRTGNVAFGRGGGPNRTRCAALPTPRVDRSPDPSAHLLGHRCQQFAKLLFVMRNDCRCFRRRREFRVSPHRGVDVEFGGPMRSPAASVHGQNDGTLPEEKRHGPSLPKRMG